MSCLVAEIGIGVLIDVRACRLVGHQPKIAKYVRHRGRYDED